MSKPSKHYGGLPHNGVFRAESKVAKEKDEYLRTCQEATVKNWDDDRICYSGIDKDGEIFEDYWVPRPDEDEYEVGKDYKL
jgi:chloramphenicol O-acetyltransferase